MAAALFAFILDRVPAPRRGPWDSVASIIPERKGTVEEVSASQAEHCTLSLGCADPYVVNQNGHADPHATHERLQGCAVHAQDRGRQAGHPQQTSLSPVLR
jgi:hypothetical protein